MVVIAINARGNLWSHADRDPDRLSRALEALAPSRPVPILVHGFRYAPGAARDDPHRLILSPGPVRARATPSWPRHLGFRGQDGEGLCIGFGWQARGTIWQARAEAARAGLALAALIARIAALSPGRRVTVMAHSLGARVVMAALPALGPGDLSRAVLLYPALMRAEVAQAMAGPAAARVEIVTVTSRENLVFDLGNEILFSAGLDRSAGRGLRGVHPGWIDLPIDDAAQIAHLAREGFAVAGPQQRICHWSAYLRPGLFALYRALIVTDPALTLSRLVPPHRADVNGLRDCMAPGFAIN